VTQVAKMSLWVSSNSLDFGDLKVLASWMRVEDLGQSLSLRDIQNTSTSVSKKTPPNDLRLDDYFFKRVAKEVAANIILFTVKEKLLEGVGKTSVFDRAVVRHLASLLEKLRLKNVIQQQAILEIGKRYSKLTVVVELQVSMVWLWVASSFL
jgi:hypothetical protein